MIPTIKNFCMISKFNTIISFLSSACTPVEGMDNLPYEPIEGIGWLMNGAASVVLGNRLSSNSVTYDEATSYIISAKNAFRMCLNIRKKCLDHNHISAFAQYELALLLLRDDIVCINILYYLKKASYNNKYYYNFRPVQKVKVYL